MLPSRPVIKSRLQPVAASGFCMPSGPGRITHRLELLEQPIATAEFLVVDTETNGLGGDACELTELGAVLVGGGELHDRWDTLVRTNMPLGRGIQRFTGITQQMVDAAPAPDQVLPQLQQRLEGRVMVAHNAPFDRRVLRQAFDAHRPGVAEPAGDLHRRARADDAAAAARAPAGALADALGIDVALAHRALADAETCARVLCALFPKLCANAATIAEAVALLKPKRPKTPRRSRTLLRTGAGEAAAA